MSYRDSSASNRGIKVPDDREIVKVKDTLETS